MVGSPTIGGSNLQKPDEEIISIIRLCFTKSQYKQHLMTLNTHVFSNHGNQSRAGAMQTKSIGYITKLQPNPNSNLYSLTIELSGNCRNESRSTVRGKWRDDIDNIPTISNEHNFNCNLLLKFVRRRKLAEKVVKVHSSGGGGEKQRVSLSK